LAGLEPGQHGYGNEGDRAESGDQLSDEDESDEDKITQAVPFKCIGAAHKKKNPTSFGTGIPCSSWTRYIGECKNTAGAIGPMDTSAIDLDYGTGWTHVGYIASELCKYLHPLIATGDILEVYVQHWLTFF
jgi:hypothetical protein